MSAPPPALAPLHQDLRPLCPLHSPPRRNPPVCSCCLRPPQSVWTRASRLLLLLMLLMLLCGAGVPRSSRRGAGFAADLTAAVRPSAKDTSRSSAKRGDSKRSVGRPGTQGGNFDFDTFYKSHYSEQLQRQQAIRVRKEEMLKRKRETVGDKKLGRVFEIAVGIMLIFAFGLIKNINKG